MPHYGWVSRFFWDHWIYCACGYIVCTVCIYLKKMVFLCLVPADVFSLNSGWAGFYEYLGKRQAATITVNAFNSTTSRVNVTLLEQSGVQIKLSGEL